MSYFAIWRTTAVLCSYGLRDHALLCVVARVPFSSPWDRDFAAVAESGGEECILALDQNLWWCRLPVLQGQRIIRLLRSGELTLCVHAFRPNHPQVLSGASARLLPLQPFTLGGLTPAREQPERGFETPHRVRASLRLGPKADFEEIRRTLAGVRSVAVP